MAAPKADRTAAKYGLLRGLLTTAVSAFQVSGDSYICGELFLLREAVSECELQGEFVQVLFDLDLVGSYVLEGNVWRLTDVKTDGDLASMQCTGAATMLGDPLDIEQVKSLILRADLKGLIQDQKKSFFETRTLTDDDADLDNCKFVSIYRTVPCVLLARTSLML
jgi:hypothetical protein